MAQVSVANDTILTNGIFASLLKAKRQVWHYSGIEEQRHVGSEARHGRFMVVKA